MCDVGSERINLFCDENLPPTCRMYPWMKTALQASQIFLRTDQSMHQQESFAWHKYHTLPRECLTYITQLPAEVILQPVVAVSFVEM